LAKLAQDKRGGYKNTGLLARTYRTVARWIAALAEAFGFKDLAARFRGVSNDEARELVHNLFSKLRANAPPTPGGGARGDAAFMSAGEKAKGAKLGRLKVAKKMEAAGETRGSILAETGWWKEKDDTWRFEIDDSKMRRKRGFKGDGDSDALRNLIIHPDLFQAYPQLGDVIVTVDNTLRSLGATSADGKKITLNLAKIKLHGKDVREVLVHEIQHAVQEIEGFAPGGNTYMASDYLLGRPVEEVVDQMRELEEKEIAADRTFWAIAKEWHKPGTPEAKAWRERLIKAKAEKLRLEKELSDLEKLIDKKGPGSPAAYKTYRNLLGEKEGENTAARLSMSARQRKELEPWETMEDPENAIVLPREQGGTGAREMALPPSPRTPFKAQGHTGFASSLHRVAENIQRGEKMIADAHEKLAKAKNTEEEQEFRREIARGTKIVKDAKETVLHLGRTPVVLRHVAENGMNPFRKSDMVIGQGSSIYLKGTDQHFTSRHEAAIPMETLEKLPELLADPAAVFKSSRGGDNPNSFLIMLKSKVGEMPIVVAVEPMFKVGENKGEVVNLQMSVYPVPVGAPGRWVEQGRLRYYDDKANLSDWLPNDPRPSWVGVTPGDRSGGGDATHSVDGGFPAAPSLRPLPGDAPRQGGSRRDSAMPKRGATKGKINKPAKAVKPDPVITKSDIEAMPESRYSKQSGHAQPLTAQVLTPAGFKRMGDMRIGDRVITLDGGSTKVSGVYPQAEMDLFRVVLSDGTETRASEDHLWVVRPEGSTNFRVMSLAQMMPGIAAGKRYELPEVER
jgi:hypothetical protein